MGDNTQSTGMTDAEEDGFLGNFAKERGVLVNLALVILAISGAVLFLVLYLLFWIIDMDLLGDPEPVWAQAMWFAPQMVLVVLLFQAIAFPMSRNPLRSTVVWGIVAGLVAGVLDVVVSIFYFRLFWQCVTNTGSFEPLEDDICDNHLAELSVIAWFNFVFFFHALLSIVVCAWAYTKDLSRMENLREKFASLRTAVSARAQPLLKRIKEEVKLDGDMIKTADDKKFARIIGSLLPTALPANGDLATYTDARSKVFPTRRKAGGGVTRMDHKYGV